MNYFTRYFTAYFKVERFPAGNGLLAGVARGDKEKIKRWLEKKLVKTASPKTGRVAFSGHAPKAKVEVYVPEWTPKSVTPFEVSEGVKRPLLRLKAPRKQKAVKSDKAVIAARKAEAMRLAKRKVEEEVLLMALI